MLVMAGTNAVLLLPSWFYLKSPYPPSGAFKMRSIWLAWKDVRYTLLMLGLALLMTK